MNSLVEDWTKNVPSGSDAAVHTVKYVSSARRLSSLPLKLLRLTTDTV